MRFFGIPVLGKFGPKNQNCQFNLKFGIKPKSNMHDSIYVNVFPFWNRTFSVFFCFGQKGFLQKFGLKIQNCLK